MKTINSYFIKLARGNRTVEESDGDPGSKRNISGHVNEGGNGSSDSEGSNGGVDSEQCNGGVEDSESSE